MKFDISKSNKIEEFIENSNGTWASWHPATSTGFMDYCILYQPDNILGARFDHPPDEDAQYASCQAMRFIFNESNCKEVMTLKQKGE